MARQSCAMVPRWRFFASCISASRPSRRPTAQSASAAYRCCLLLSRFEYIDRRTCPGLAPCCPHNCFTCGYLDHHLIDGSLCPLWTTRVHIPNGVSIGSAAFTEITVVTDRRTDRTRCSSSVMWPNNSRSGARGVCVCVCVCVCACACRRRTTVVRRYRQVRPCLTTRNSV